MAKSFEEMTFEKVKKEKPEFPEFLKPVFRVTKEEQEELDREEENKINSRIHEGGR